jgi:hypothetical protein
MPLALTIFGVAKGSSPGALCYTYARFVRGPGNYPAPALPSSIRRDGVWRVPLAGSDDIDVVIWDKIFDEDATNIVQAQINSGRFVIPAECPIEPGAEIAGQSFGPIIVAEKNERVRVAGTGVLYVRGIAIDGGLDRVTRCVESVVGAAKAPEALARLIECVTEQSGLGLFFQEGRRLGVVDLLYRARNEAGILGPLFNVSADKTDWRSRGPVRRVRIHRDTAPLDQAFRFHVTLKNYDEILRDLLLEMPAGQAELFVEADTHITDVDLSVFHQDGSIGDRVIGSFLQSFEFGVTAIGRADELPPVFRGAPDVADLQTRPRIHTTAFKGPSAGNRSGGLDDLRQLRARIGLLVGDPEWSGENQWFELGRDGQVEVIRWIKGKLERPGITKAYLVDPYLGSEALQRVIARQGHENVELTILVSPGKRDPDADEADVEATSDYLAKLVGTANEWSDRLCGRVSIVHIRRGDGRRQAFHDRYLSLVDQRGVPAVYLLSNSLSKAAGDWPFAICELNRITSWQVQFYILDLIKGVDRNRDLYPEVVWQSAQVANSLVGASATEGVAGNAQPEWVTTVNALLGELYTAVLRNSTHGNEITSVVDAFLAKWPEGIDAKLLAEHIFRRAGHRGEAIAWISSRFAMEGADRQDVADKLDAMALDKFLSELPRGGRKAASYPPLRNRNGYLGFIGRVIARKPAPTNFVRDRLNPVVNELVETIETQRFGSEIAGDSLLNGICLISVGLEVAIAAETAKLEFRVGLAADYIHWMGRFMRSDIAFGICNTGTTIPDIVGNDLVFTARQIAIARRVLGDMLAEPVSRVLSDPLVVPAFKEMVRGERQVTSQWSHL